MVHDDQIAAGPQHPPGLVERTLGIRHDAYHIGRQRDIESRVGKLEFGRVHHAQALDMREAPALVVIEELLQAGAKCRVHDPEALENARKIFDDRVTYHKTNYEALAGSDALLILTEWNEFRHPNFQRIKAELKEPVIFDGRNLYDPELMKALELRYYSIGRHPV